MVFFWCLFCKDTIAIDFEAVRENGIILSHNVPIGMYDDDCLIDEGDE